MGWLGSPKEKRMQLYFRDDARAMFRRLPIMDASVIEEDKQTGKPLKGWMDKYKMLFPFAGYRSISGGAVAVAFDRSPLMDVWGILDNDEKLPKNASLEHPLVQEVAKSRQYKIDTTVKGDKKSNWIVLMCGAGMLIEIIGMLLFKLYG